jgi:hypothetical protein
MMRLLRLLACALLLMAGFPALVNGQAAWEYTPYQIRIWVALDPVPQLPSSLIGTLGQSLPARAETVMGPVVQSQVAAAPARLRGSLLKDLDAISVDAIAAAAGPGDLEADKIFLTAITRRGGEPLVRIRELDVRSRQLEPAIERACSGVGALSLALCDAISESFTPLARIEQVSDQTFTLRLRAGGLITEPTSLVVVEPGMVLRPIIRRNDRSGQPTKGGIQPIPWSFLTIDERHDSVLECTLKSGYRSAIPAKGGVRMERLALLVRPRFDETKLVLHSRTDTSKPLMNYEIHQRIPDSTDTHVIGLTDSRGSVTVYRGDGTLETLVVKNGKQLLARLPLVPGYEKALTAYVVDDDGRLAAEGFVAALYSRALDLVARREILASRIRARLKDGKTGEAQKLLDEFRRLDTRADLNRDLDRYRQQVVAADKVTEQRVEKIFSEAQRLLLLKPLSDELLAQLTREVGATKSSAAKSSAVKSGGE